MVQNNVDKDHCSWSSSVIFKVFDTAKGWEKRDLFCKRSGRIKAFNLFTSPVKAVTSSLAKDLQGLSNKRCTHLLQDWDEKMSCILIQNCNPCPAATQLGTCLNSEGTSLSHNPPQYLQFYFCHAQNCPYLSYLASYSHLSPVRTPKESGALESLKYT